MEIWRVESIKRQAANKISVSDGILNDVESNFRVLCFNDPPYLVKLIAK